MKSIKAIMKEKKDKKRQQKEKMFVKEDENGYLEMITKPKTKKINVITLFDKVK